MKTKNKLTFLVLFITLCSNAQINNSPYKDSVFYNLNDAFNNAENVYNLKLQHYQSNVQKTDFSVFVNLVYLKLSYDSIHNLPLGLDKLERLKVLDISGNNFTILPEQIALIPNLQELYLNNEKYLDLTQSFIVINKITTLKRLHLDSIPNFKLPNQMKLNKNIEYISMRYDGLTEIPSQMRRFVHLKSLDMEGNNIKYIGKNFLRNKEIESLFLSISPKFNFKKSFTVLAKERSLNTLAILNSNLESLPNEISLLNNIRTLYLQNDHLTSFPIGIFKMKNLKYLDISGNDFKFIPPNFVELNNLEFLNLSNEKNLSYEQTAELINQLPSLHLLKVGDYDYTFDDSSFLDFNKDKDYIELLSKNKKNNRVHLFKNINPVRTTTNMIPLNNFNAEGFGIRLGW